MNIRVSQSLWTGLLGHLWTRTDVEAAGLLLGEHLPEADVVVVREVIPVPESAFEERLPDRISINAVAMNRLMRPARDRGWSVFTIHTHPGTSDPWFSWADDAGDARLMPSLHVQMPGRPHGSIVLVPDGRVAARSFDEVGSSKDVTLTVVGSELRELTSRAPPGAAEAFSRQVLALGRGGQARLAAARVLVVGAGGTGSIAATTLLHLGVGEVAAMDADVVELSNVSRIVGARRTDVGRPKVSVLERYAKDLGVDSFVPIREALTSENVHRLARYDLIFSCVDRHTPRALLNRLAYQFCIPVIDMGTAFRVDPAGRASGDAGRVVVVGPGRPCLACWGDVHPDVLRWEATSPEEQAELLREGYIAGADVAQPSVMPFNGVVAHAAVIEGLRLLAGFCSEDGPQRVAFSFSGATARRNRLPEGSEGCTVCRGPEHGRAR